MKSFKFQVSGSKLPAKMLNLKLETRNLKFEVLVPRRGLDPPRVPPLEPESSASTNSATSAWTPSIIREPAGRRTLPRDKFYVNAQAEKTVPGPHGGTGKRKIRVSRAQPRGHLDAAGRAQRTPAVSNAGGRAGRQGRARCRRVPAPFARHGARRPDSEEPS